MHRYVFVNVVCVTSITQMSGVIPVKSEQETEAEVQLQLLKFTSDQKT